MKQPDKNDFGFNNGLTTEKWNELGGQEAYREAYKSWDSLQNRVLKSKQTYTFSIEKYEDGSSAMIRCNDGFNAYELLGVLSIITKEVIDQQEGRIKPDIIKRNYIEDEKAK